MNKIFFIIGLILPLPAYFSDAFAGFIQNLGGKLWSFFSDFGVILYPVYLSIFFIPLYIIIAFSVVKSKPELAVNKIFFMMFYGFIGASILFILFAIIAISQFNFTQ